VLWKKLRFRDKNYFHSRLFKQKKWDGFHNFYSKETGKFLTGILPEIQLVLDYLKIKYEIIDNRELIKWRVNSIDDNFLNYWLSEYNANVSEKEQKEDYTLRDFQPDIVNGILKNYRGLVVAPTGCHAKGQPILMYDGSIHKVEDIRVGDQLMGPDSNPRTVVSLYSGIDDLYKIIPNKGDEFTVNSCHVLTLVSTCVHKNRYKSEKGGVITDIPLNKYLKWSKWKKHINKLFKTEVNFPDSVLPIDPYFLGILLGDGSIVNSPPDITTVDKEILYYIQKQAKIFNLKITGGNSKTKTPTYNISGKPNHTNPITTILKKIGVWGCDSSTKFIPNIFKITSKENRLQILAGLMDTDGHYDNQGQAFDYISKSQILANDVVFIARSLGFHAQTPKQCIKKSQNGTAGIYYRTYISGKIYNIPCKIARKKPIKKKSYYNVLRTGFKVEHLKKGKYYGFELKEDPHYLLGDFTVTHNTGKTAIMTSLVKCLPKHCPTLILSNRKGLSDQHYKDLKNWGIQDIGRLYDKHKEPNFITCATWQSAGKLGKLLPKIRALIVDEVHEMTSVGSRKIYNKLTGACVRVGISGTPFKFGGKDNTQKWITKGYFGPPIKIKSADGGVLTVKEAQKKNMLSLCKATFWPIRTPMIPYDIYMDAVTRGIAENYDFHNIVVNLVKTLKGRTLILVERIAHGDILHNMIPNSLWIQGKDNLETRKEVLDELMFSSSCIAIATQGIFNTGVNFYCHNLINTAGGQADHTIIQRIGRGLRPSDDKEHLNYHDFYFHINDYLEDHSKKRIKIMKSQGHEVIIKDTIDFI
jgi:superfamily II DNA or RNA helicase